MPIHVGADERGMKIVKKLDQLKSRRFNWERHWQEVAEYVIPRKDNIYGERIEGEKKFNLLYDSTSIQSLTLLTSALNGLLTNPASVWFGLGTGSQEIDNREDVRTWLQEVVHIMIQVMNQSNFQPQVHEFYTDLGGFGTGYMRVLPDDESKVRFESRPIYDALVAENHRGIVDTVYYEYDMTAKQLEQQFGEEILDDVLREKLRDDPLHKEKIIHAVEPRELVPFKPKTPENMPFASYHVLRRTGTVLKESGFHSNPNIVARWDKLSSEVYGRGPGMKALSDIKMLNKMKKATIESAQLAVAPALQVPDDGVLLPIRTRPNSVNYYRAGTKDRIEPLNTGSRPDISEELMELTRNQIREAFFIDQLQLIQQDRMTTTEVMQRRDEQLRLLGPLLGRMNSEFLKPLIDRVFDILLRAGEFPAPPDILKGADLEVKYISQIAKAQRTSEAENVTRAFTFLSPFFEVKPEIFDNFSADGMVDYASEIFGIPEQILTSDRDKQVIRESRTAANAEQNQLDVQQQQADIQRTQGS